MVKLLQQTLGDMEDRISSSGRIIRTVLPEEPLYISGDGKRLYRVYQNLIENALKYSMEGTRIYVEGRVEEQKVITEIKNIAAYEMDFTADKIVNDSREEMSTGQRKDMDWAWQLPKVFQRPVADILISLLTAICLKRLFPIHYIGKIDSCLTCSCKSACFLI
ncbi:MAG: sensor histidine kinase [Lachnospiraceae bacterium]